MSVQIINGVISLGIMFVLGCVGEIITEKSGHLNLGIPGIMCMGAAGGCLGVAVYIGSLQNPESANWFVLVVFAVTSATIFGAFGGAIYSFLTVTLRSNQNVTGLALTTFGTGFASFVINRYCSIESIGFSNACAVLRSGLNFEKLGWFGEIFLSRGILVYLGIAVAVCASILLKRTKVGLNLRAIGENPATADATGVNVSAYKYTAILTGSAIAGLGGLFYVVEVSRGTYENGGATLQAYGWLAIALVVFCMWKPSLSILGSILFGFMYKLSYITIEGVNINSHILKLTPYVVTVVVLIITSIFGSKNVQPPASLGVNYFREER